VLRERVRAALKPMRWVPPSVVLMLLTKERIVPVVALFY